MMQRVTVIGVLCCSLAVVAAGCAGTSTNTPPLPPGSDREPEPQNTPAPEVAPKAEVPIVAKDQAPSAQPQPQPQPPPSGPTPPSLPLRGAVPAFATLRYDAEKSNPYRAVITGITSAYAPQSLSPLDVESTPHAVYLPVPVLDADEDGTPRRVRVVCDGRFQRVGLAVDEASFQPLLRSQTFVSPTPTRRKKINAKTPGVRLAAGTTIGRQESERGMMPIDHSGLFLRAQGYVPVDAVDLVFEPAPMPDDRVRNGKLLDNVEFLDAPDGEALARTNRGAQTANELHVRTLSSSTAGHVLVRYREHDAFVVGWVPVDAVQRYPSKTFRPGESFGGFGSGRRDDSVTLARGTLLVAPSSSEIVGVVTRSSAYVCDDTCDDEVPLVRLRACAHPIAVFAVTPDA